MKLQKDIDRLCSWARKWGTKFQPVKCNMIQLTNKRTSKIQASYKPEVTVLENVESTNYLGVTKDGIFISAMHARRPIGPLV